ncbi:helix-turn-helix domain-containing protein [Phytoactinopolyspora limicola]|uniref:helix-turn-helix domain-containing protein n=1 Tax=Phytoactinopolyspora limicola TaxID=2715536 RepID=UPI00140BF3DD|nr:helix-turn-helix domain-containing protein [Phytoactinopolyspora limicola]
MSASNRAELLAGYAAGVPVRELATRFDVHRGAVWEVARRAGLELRRPELSEATRAEAARLYGEGLTLAGVAAQLGISDDSVRAAVIAYGGTVRPAGRRRVHA